MKLAVIIISQNQVTSMPGMLKSLSKLTADRFWVLDRCTDSSEAWLWQHGETNIIVNTSGTGFLAGKMRDLGIDAVLSKGGYDAILFLDGDRVPLKPVTNLAVLRAYHSFDIAMCPLESDIRLARPFRRFKDYQPNQFISCGFLIKIECLQVVRELDFMNNRCFHEAFDGVYGYEDCYFGKILKDIGYTIGWSNIVVKGAIIFDDFSKMVSLSSQRATYETLYQQFGVHLS